MSLTPAQLTTLKAAILADQGAEPFYTIGDLSGLAEYMNAAASPAKTVWRTAVSKDEITQNGFDWTRLDNLSIGKARVWDGLFDNAARSMNPAKVNVRAGIEAVWAGNAQDLAVRAQVYVHCKRPASRIEAIFAVGTGTDAVPATMAFVGPVNFSEFVGL